MKYWLDTEFNEHGGELVSVGLISEDERMLYFELSNPGIVWGAWVKEHMVPLLSEQDLVTRAQAAKLLQKYFENDRFPEIIADWPVDIEHLCSLLITGPGECISMPSMTFRFVRFGKTVPSDKPHHALYDAIVLKHTSIITGLV